ncbi:hypothetical protein M407DRAFT_219867 [Tulasnella calospora MUT 4182]|uniref:Zn(2)-C6 fungal-type domain-containing protein n=1 Tax=Tulasnella calospora MUT 4182 TaxID=1051891 RepID=A0A0C3QRS0_9AGAM|nr:hypothetical protein M407DRAFT_219867 [Tulasnella calospora MUT 4182]
MHAVEPPSSTTHHGPRRNLKKNQACLQCRRGKMKCDAAQPHCTNCIKAWQLLLETPGVPGSSVPSCDYDPVEGLIFTPEIISDPAARVKAIQDQLAARYVIPPSANSRSSNPGATDNGNGNPRQLQQLPPGFAEYHADRARRLINAALTEHQDSLYLEQDGVDVSCHRRHSDENGSSSTSTVQAQGGGCPSRSSTSDSSSSSSAATRTRTTSSRTGSRDDQQPPLLPRPGPPPAAAAADDSEDRDARKRRIRVKRDSKLFADMVQPLIVLATYYYHEGRGPEVWADVGALTRAIMSLGLNHPSEPSRRGSSKETLIAQEERKRAFWSTFMLDRLLSVGGWSHSMTEEDTVQNFAGNAALLNSADFRDLGVPRSPKPQQPQQQSRQYVHPKSPDSYSLLLDAVVLLGRITDFRNRARLNHRSALGQSILTNKSNQHSDNTISFRDASFSFILSQDPILRWDFSQLSAELNGGVGYWSSYGISGKGRREGNMPLLFKYSIGLADVPDDGKGLATRRRSAVDMDLFLAHMVHYSATILLHFPVASFNVQSRTNSHQSTPPSLHTPPRSGTIPPINFDPFPQQRQTPPSAEDYHPPQPLPSLFHPLPSGDPYPPQQRVVVDTGAMVSTSCMSDSRKECVDAARKIVDALALLRCTTFDIGHVHPFGAVSGFFGISRMTCWYIAAVVLLYEHRRWVDEGDVIQQTAISKDVQILRLSLLKYGQRSEIGRRLEEQLTRIQERIAAPPRGTPPSDDSSSENAEEYRHDVIPIFPFDRATYQSLPKNCPPSWGAPLPQYLF